LQRDHLPLSILQEKVEPDSLETNEKVALVAVVVAAGPPEMVVSGAVLSPLGRVVLVVTVVWPPTCPFLASACVALLKKV
jgi:hypothetical protein